MELQYPDGATPLDPDEMEGLKHLHVEARAELDQLEQQNIQQGYVWIERQRKHKDFLSENFLRDLHKKLFGAVWSWAGLFRKTDKNIGVDYRTIGVELRNLLDDARYWIEHKTYKRQEFAARFHHRLVQIHAFPNGNGRHARIMTDIVLEKVLKTDPVDWGAESDFVSAGEHRKTYIQALREADKHNYQPLIAFVSTK